MGNLKDYATGVVAVAPSPQDSGTTLELEAGQGDRYPAVPFSATAHPPGEFPDTDNAEKVLVTDITDDVVTFTRAQGDTVAQSIDAGWRLSNTLFKADLDEKQNVVQFIFNSSGLQEGNRYNVWQDLIDAINATPQVNVNVYFEQNEVIPAGTYMLPPVIFHGNFGSSALNIDFDEAILEPSLYIGIQDSLYFNNIGSTPVITYADGIVTNLVMYIAENAGFASSATTEFLRVEDMAQVNIYMGRMSAFFNNGTEPIDLTDSGAVNVSLYTFAADFPSNTVRGTDDASVSVGIESTALFFDEDSWTQDNFTATNPPFLNYWNAARLMNYDNTDSGLGATNVQDAIDELAAETPISNVSLVVKEAVAGSINGSNTTFFTVNPYVGDTLQVYVNGLAQGQLATETNPATGEFELDSAPLTGDDIKVYYHMADTGTGNSDTVDGKEAAELSQVGDILMSLRSTPGINRLFMDGGTYNKADWPLLWDVVDNNPGYGVTDASTFTLIDMRERSVVGQKAGGPFATLGASVGNATHTHPLSDNGFAAIRFAGGVQIHRRIGNIAWTAVSQVSISTVSANTTTQTDGAALRGATDAADNLPPSKVINYEVIAG